MSAVSVDDLDSATIRGLVARAGNPQRERWLEQVRRTGACRHPVRLRGVVLHGDEPVYSTVDEPDGALMVRCGNRREAQCPSCAHEYRGDMWQLVYAGLAGGRKGVPEQVAEHAQVFATLTAPGFGTVHSRPDDGRSCRCGERHDTDDPRLGQAIDSTTYDYEGAVLWNWHAPALWNRFIIELARVLASRAGLSERAWRKLVRVAYAKVAEFQARGLVHFHAIIRLDSAEDRAAPPGIDVTAEELCDAIHQAAANTSLDGDAGNDHMIELRFGEQLHTRTLASNDTGELRADQVAAYVAKYSSKASHDQITTRDTNPERWRDRGIPEQLVQMATAALRRSESPGLRGLGRWVHMLGFRGHFVTKSRGYSTTLGELRAARATYRAHQDQAPNNTRTLATRPRCCPSGNTLAPATSTPATYCSPQASKRPYAPPATHCSICAAGHRNDGIARPRPTPLPCPAIFGPRAPARINSAHPRASAGFVEERNSARGLRGSPPCMEAGSARLVVDQASAAAWDDVIGPVWI